MEFEMPSTISGKYTDVFQLKQIRLAFFNILTGLGYQISQTKNPGKIRVYFGVRFVTM